MSTSRLILQTPLKTGIRAAALAYHSSTTRPVILLHQHLVATHRHFSTSPVHQVKEFFPEPDTPTIHKTPAAWPHPVYTAEQMNSVAIAHRETRDWSDRVALFAVKVLRTGLDFASGYRHDKAVALGQKDPTEAKRKYAMTEKKYLTRNIFLESVAGRFEHPR